MVSICLLAFGGLACTADPVDAAVDVSEIRKVIRLASMDLTSGVQLSSDKIVYAGESPLLYEQIRQAEKQWAANPNNLPIFRELVALQARLNDPVKARAGYRQLIQLEEENVQAHPKSAEAHYSLALAYYCGGKLPEALAAARKSTELDPNNPHAWQVLHWCLRTTDEAAALQALEKSIQLTPADDLDLRLDNAMIHAQLMRDKFQKAQQLVQLRQASLIKLPGHLNDEGDKIVEEYQRSLKNVDQVLSVATTKLTTDNGQCGDDTRDRCLAMLLMRDIIRNGVRNLPQADPRAEVGGAAIQAETLKLMRQVVPLNSDDPVRLFCALFVEVLGNPMLPPSGQNLPDAVKEAVAPYLKRLDELSHHAEPSLAATAAYMNGLVYKILNHSPTLSMSYLQRCVKLCPDFGDGWQLLIISHVEQQDFPKAIEVARAWHTHSPSETSLFCLAKVYSEAGHWDQVHKTVEQGCQTYPESLRFRLARIAVALQSAKFVEGSKHMAELTDLGKKIAENGHANLIANYALLGTVMYLLDNDLPAARNMSRGVLSAERDPERRKRLQKLLKLDTPEMKIELLGPKTVPGSQSSSK